MITHEICRDEMGAWLDGELSRGRAAQIRAHLDACAACSDHLAQLRRVSQDVRSLPRETMPADLKADILRAAARGVPAAPRRALWTFAASSLAAAAALVLIVVVLRQSEPGLSQPALTVEQERAASAADLDDGKLALNKQAAVLPEKKAGEGYVSGDAKESAEPAPAAAPPAIAGRLDKVLKDNRAGAEEARRDAPLRSKAAAQVPRETAAQRESAVPQEFMGSQKPAAMPAQDEELERQEKAATAHNAGAARYAAVLLESPGAMVLVSEPVPISTDTLSASRFNEADKLAGLKGKVEEPSGARERRAQAPAAAPTSVTAGAAGAPAESTGLDASVQRVQVLVQLDAQGVIREVEPLDPPSLDATRAARIRSLLAGRTLPGLLPGAQTAILQLTIRTGP